MIKKGKILVVAEVIILVIVILAIVTGIGKSKTTHKAIKQNTERSNQIEKTKEFTGEFAEDRIKFSQDIESLLSKMTVEEKVAQLFLVTPEALTGAEQGCAAGEDVEKAIQKYPVAGIIYSAEQIGSVEETADMLTKVQEYANTRSEFGMFLGIREMGGEENSPLAAAGHYEQQMSLQELGLTKDTKKAAEATQKIVDQLKSEGFNMNLALKSDVSANGGISADPNLVSEMVGTQLSVYDKDKITGVLDSFPGKADCVVDPATNLHINNTSMDVFKKEELKVFRSSIQDGVSCIIVGNEAFKALTDDVTLPCSLSPAVMYYLRNNLRFNGVLMTDILTDESMNKNYTAGEASVAALKAGCNLLYVSSDFENAYQMVVDAVKAGTISETMVDNSVGRILKLKFNLKIATKKEVVRDNKDLINEEKDTENTDDQKTEDMTVNDQNTNLDLSNNENGQNNQNSQNNENNQTTVNQGNTKPQEGTQVQPTPDPEPQQPDPEPQQPDPEPQQPDPEPQQPDPEPQQPDSGDSGEVVQPEG